MKYALVLTLVTALLSLTYTFGAPTDNESELFLTPLIKNGDLDQARAQSEDNMKLANIQSLVAIKSYSGYLTIDEKTNSNLFFWFFPSQKTPEQDPVILWINQAPGYSSLQGIFVETGPFHVDSESTVTPRNFSWTKSHSMLYIDSPVGTGFSFTDSPEAYANGFDEDGAELCEALKQFFTIFKEFQDREFYLAGEDYAAVFIPSIIKTIEAENAKGGLKINLKGFMVGSPYMDSKQVHNAQTLYNFGLIDKKQKAIMDGQIEKAFKMIENGQAKEGEQLALSISYGPNSLLAKFTGFQDYSNALASKPRPEIAWYRKFISSKEAHNYLHVGVHKYVEFNYEVLQRFIIESYAQHDDALVEMLNKGYRVLIFAPQFNIFTTQVGIEEIVEGLKWNGADKFSEATRQIWKVNDDVAGYVKTADNFTYAVIRNAGNYAILDQPEWVLDLVEKFLQNKF